MLRSTRKIDKKWIPLVRLKASGVILLGHLPVEGAFLSGDSMDILPKITCNTCRACCCRLEVMLMGDDDVPRQMTLRDRWGGWIMRRLDDGWCAALDRETMRCTIYGQRPFICREYQEGDYDCLEQRKQLDA